jgi:uncharacterized surface protein with fasciclin (FAS1) repeats
MTTSKRFFLFLASLMLVSLLAACTNEEDIPEASDVGDGIEVTGMPRQTICHFTGSAVLPYVEIAISDEAVERHSEHEGDLIPAPAEGCPVSVDETDDDDATNAPDATARPNATQAPIRATQSGLCSAEDQTLADFIGHDDRFSQFEELMNESGMLPLLDEGIELTVFVPTNEAFDSLEDADDLLNDDTDRNALASYHIAEGMWDTDMLDDLDELVMLSGEVVRIRTVEDEIVLNDDTRISEKDVALCNGMAQVIDDVLVPPIFDDKIDITPTPASTRTAQPTPTREPTDTPRPDNPTRIPTRTPLPPEPTPTRIPTRTPQPTDPPDDPTATDEPPTPAPTDAPTDEPPTAAPTDAPTSEPTEALVAPSEPTPKPTKAPKP